MKTAIGNTETRDSLSIKLDFFTQARLVCASYFAYSFLWQLFFTDDRTEFRVHPFPRLTKMAIGPACWLFTMKICMNPIQEKLCIMSPLHIMSNKSVHLAHDVK